MSSLVEAQPQDQTVIVSPTTRNVRVKGTWTMYYGQQQWDFVDGHRYDLPLDVFDYLRSSGNVYDTL